MLHPTLRRLASIAALLLALRAAAAETPHPPPSSADLFGPATFTLPKLSPNGQFVAVLERLDDSRYALNLIDLAARSKRPLIRDAHLNVRDFWWKADDVIVFLVEESAFTRTFRALNLKTMVVSDLTGLRYTGIRIVNLLHDDPEHMLVGLPPDRIASFQNGGSDNVISLARANVRTGEMTPVETRPGSYIESWITNRAGEALGVWGSENSQWFLDWRTGAKEAWHRIDLPKGRPPPWRPLGLAPDQRRFIVEEVGERTFSRVSLLDPVTAALEPVPGPPDADVAFVDKWGSQESLAIIGYRSEGDNLRFLDPEAEEVHRWIGTLFPGVLAKCESFSRDDRRIIVSLSSDRNPGVYFLLDRAAKKATPLSRAYAAIDPNLMAPTRTFRFAAGDGLPLSGRITLPAGVAKPPLVVVVGPSFTSPAPEGFDRTAQFFASRGYATARINHRGVIGFGRSFLIAGDLQVATGMASDLAEGVKWLAAQGWTDPHRVALFADQWGALTAVPLAARADAFRAIVNLSPPLDLAKLTADDLLATAGRSEEELALVAGDSKTFAAYRNSVDPVAAIGRISIPAFYHFERGAGEVVPGPVRHLEERLKKQGAVYELDIAPSLAKWDVLKLGSYPEWKEEARTFDAVGGFLQKHL